MSWLLLLSAPAGVILPGFYMKNKKKSVSMHLAATVSVQPEVICPNAMQLPGKFADYIKNLAKTLHALVVSVT